MVAVCALSASSCLFSRSKAAKIAPPPVVAARPATPVEEKPPQIPPPDANPPATAPVPEPAPSKTLEVTPELPGPPKEPKRPRRARARTTPPAPAAAPPATPVAEPELVPLLSASDKRAFEAIVNALIARTEKNLAVVEAREPNQQQRDVIRQARNFLAQCQEIRGRDLAAAKSLAERAEILSRELVGKLR